MLRTLEFLPFPAASKLILCLFCCLYLPILSIAATRTSTTSGGEWNSKSTWVGGQIPLAGDDVVIATIGTGAVIVDNLSSCVNLTINSKGRLIIGGTNTLNVSGNVNIPRPASGYTSELNVNAGTLNVMGLFAMGASKGKLQAYLIITTGTANLSGLTTRGLASGIIFKGDGVLNLSGEIRGAIPTLEAGLGTVNFTGTSLQNIWPKMYHNLGISGSGTKMLSGRTTVSGTVNIDGELSLKKYDLILTGPGNPLIVGGTLATAAGDVVYAGEDEQIIAAIPYFQLSLVGAGTKKLLAGTSVLVSQDWIVDSPTLLEGDSKIEISRDMRGTGTLEMESGLLTIGGKNLRTGIFTPGIGTVEYSRTGAQKVRKVEYFNLTLSASGEKSIADGEAIVINNDLDVSSPFIIPGTATVNVKGDLIGNAAITLEDGTISIEGDWMNEGTLEAGNSTIIYEGSGDQNIAGNEYYNLETAQGGTKFLSDDVVVNNVLTVGADTEINLDNNELTLSGSGTPLVNKGTFSPDSSTVNYTSASEIEITAVNYHNLDAAGGPRKFSEYGVIGVSGAFRPGSGNFKVINSTVSFNGLNQTIPQFTFYNVILTGGGKKIIDSLINVKSLTLKNGSKLHMNTNNGAKIVVVE